MRGANRRAVIFVGGTPFSGADVVAELLAAHPHATAPPAAARFHSDPWGVPALLTGRIGLEDFITELRARELAGLVPGDALDAAIAAFRSSYDEDPLASCRGLFWELLDAVMDASPAVTLVEASPENLAEAHTLARLVPGAAFVHVVRDGRDVAAAALESGTGPGRMSAAVEWWADRLRDVERGVRGEEDGAPYAVPEQSLTTVVLDELAGGPDPQSARRALLERLGLGADGPVPGDVAPRLEPAALGCGRWRRHARGPARWWLSRRYAGTLDELAEEGNHAAAPLLAARRRLG